MAKVQVATDVENNQVMEEEGSGQKKSKDQGQMNDCQSIEASNMLEIPKRNNGSGLSGVGDHLMEKQNKMSHLEISNMLETGREKIESPGGDSNGVEIYDDGLESGWEKKCGPYAEYHQDGSINIDFKLCFRAG
ncbi:hypothetical protein SLE2022_144150 [Rubroshorea leprosula]